MQRRFPLALAAFAINERLAASLFAGACARLAGFPADEKNRKRRSTLQRVKERPEARQTASFWTETADAVFDRPFDTKYSRRGCVPSGICRICFCQPSCLKWTFTKKASRMFGKKAIAIFGKVCYTIRVLSKEVRNEDGKAPSQ